MNLIKVSFFVFAVLMFAPAYSQKVTKKVTKEICECMDKIDQSAKATILQQESEACIMQSMISNIEGLMKEYKIKEGDEQATTKMGEEIGVKLVKDCPSAMNIFVILGNQEAPDPSEEKEEAEEE